jgi:DNA topoisomerase-1
MGLTITVRGQRMQLAPKQEEMVMAWARKKDTPYVQDKVFARNFLQDLAVALGVKPPLTLDDVDFSEAYQIVDQERAAKERLTKEERKAAAAERKAEREALKAKYGYAIVNGQRVELGTYMTEPSGIFMGRGQHPLRGRWKEGATQEDVTLNLSPDAPRPEGNWGEIVWEPDSMWVARWRDSLADKMKYIWLGDTAPIKQSREAAKFDKAIKLEERLEAVRQRIEQDLTSPNPRTRMIATACFLIDKLCLRVGDEKEADEADTVGATTLRPEHVMIGEGGEVEFKFLGKDSVEWHKKLNPPDVVLQNLAELARNARPSGTGTGNGNKPQLFPDIGSRDVNAYLSSIQRGLTAKVFRTHHATMAVQSCLHSSGVTADDDEYVKWRAATLANLEAAILCNHTKQVSKTWQRTRERYKERQDKAEERIQRYREQVQELTDKLAELKVEAKEREEAATSDERKEKVREQYRKRIAKAKERVDQAKERRNRATRSLGKIKAQALIAGKKRNWNLNTSLKSYIDPRVYYEWGRSVDYNVLDEFYPAILRRKFTWVQQAANGEGAGDEDVEGVTVRTCMVTDLDSVIQLFRAVQKQFRDAGLPLDPEVIADLYLPSLERSWREAAIALDKSGKVIAFLVVGPEWTLNDETMLDVLAVVDPSMADSEGLANLLQDEVNRRAESYEVQHPRAEFRLYPQDENRWRLAPAFYEAMGLENPEADSEVIEESEDEAEEREMAQAELAEDGD